MTPAVCLDPAKHRKNLIQTPNSLQNHQQRRASAGKSCLGRYPANHARLLQRILSALSFFHYGVEFTELDAGVLGRELPIGPGGGGIHPTIRSGHVKA